LSKATPRSSHFPGINPSAPDLSTGRRTAWAWADTHAGKDWDGVDGGVWARRSMREMIRNVGRPDYVLQLGDVTHAYKDAEFQEYARLRDRSGIGRWYEIVGNHDFHGTESGLYQKYIGKPHRYVVLDGNVAWVFVSAERGRAAGILRAPTRRWLRNVVAKYQDRNLILCSHQLVVNTVRRTHPEQDFEAVLNPRRWVSELRRHYRIDAWLAAHEHGPRRTRDQVARKGRTTFINVASFSHAYHTEACNSYLLVMRAGARELWARCRDHDRRKFIGAFSAHIPLPFPVELSARPEIVDIGPNPPKPRRR